MPRKDRRANRAARELMRQQLGKVLEALYTSAAPLVRLNSTLEQDSRPPRIDEILTALDDRRAALDILDRETWKLVACAKAAGASQGAIAEALGVSAETVRRRFLTQPLAHASGDDFIRTASGYEFDPVD